MSEDQATDWELLGDFARRGGDVDQGLLRELLAHALQQRGHSAILGKDARSDAKNADNRLAVLFVLSVCWALGFVGAAWAGLPLLLCPVGFVFAIMAVASLPEISDTSVAGLLVIVAWLVAAILIATQGQFIILIVAYLVPMVFIMIYALSTRALHLRDAQDVALAVGGVIRAAPLIAPVVLLVLFLPALSADVWQVATGLDLRSLLATGLLSVGLLFVVVRLQIGSQIERVLYQRAEYLSKNPKRPEMTRKQAEATLSDDDLAPLYGIDDDGVDSSWPNAGEEYAPFLSAAEGSALQAPLTARLLVTILAVGALLSLYIYLLCSTVVSAEVASQWTNSTVSSTDVSFVGLSITFHGGPFLQLSALLGVAATAAFLSFALFEERFATALTDALLRDPTDRFLALALPYVYLRESALSQSVTPSVNQSGSSDGV